LHIFRDHFFARFPAGLGQKRFSAKRWPMWWEQRLIPSE